MKAGNGFRWRPVLGVLAVGVLACSLALQGAPPNKGGVTPADKAASSGISTAKLKVAAPVQAYRPQTVLERSPSGTPVLRLIGLDEPAAGMIASRTGGPTGCELAEECDPCNPCYVGECIAEECVSSPAAECALCDDDVFCNGVEMCDGEGFCVGTEGQVRYECVGGENEGTVCDPLDPDCPDGDCIEVKVDTDPCNRFADRICDEEKELGLGDIGDCVLPCYVTADCDDGKWCNGGEDCIAQECVGGFNAGTPCTFGGGECSGECEGGTNPGTACTSGGGECTGECVGGDNEGTACTSGGGECTGGGTCSASCSASCGGVCRTVVDPPCGSGASCVESTHACGEGRCCTGSPPLTCSRADVTCAGDWLAVGGASDTCEDLAPPDAPNAGEDYNCPKYESGIVEGSTLTQILGPAGVAECRQFQEIGDDYKLEGCDPGEWLEVTTIRYIGGFPEGVGSRMRVTFYDTAGRFIEDVITEPTGFGLDVRRTVIFSEKPVVPCEGFMALKPAVTFSPNNLSHWWGTSAGQVRVGTNDPTKLWINGAPCEACDMLMGDDEVLAFEIVGNYVADPTGACCEADGTCQEVLQWHCEEEGLVFQGIGTSCNVCQGNPFLACNTAADCWGCDAGERIDLPCEAPACPGGTCVGATEAEKVCVEGTNDGEPCGCPDGTCEDYSAYPCIDVPPACTLHACCETSGIEEARCAIGFCNTNPEVFNPEGQPCNDYQASSDCPTGETCVQVDPAEGDDCPLGWTPMGGYGYACYGPFGNDRNCCEQPIYEGWDDCALARTNLVVIPVPPPGEDPIILTFTGDNKQATFGDVANETCADWGALDPTGTTRDRGWWHAFSLDAGEGNCTDLRLDMCCTEPIHQPQWSFLYTDCAPCGGAIGTSTAQFPIGNDISANDRGTPFCALDNLWQTYERLRNGIYYHPIYTATGGHFGEYQLHITARSCPIAACCLPDGNCQLSNEPDCTDVGGYWLGFGNIPADAEPIITCDYSPCATGSCCTGPGECSDEVLGEPMTLADCSEEDEVYKGGAKCNYPEPPCPACEIMGEANCQLQPDPVGSANYCGTSDLNAKPTGVTIADDFIPDGNELSTLCVFGTYMDGKCDGSDTTTAYTPCECVWKVAEEEESFRVRVYADSTDPSAPGQPGVLISEQSLAGTSVMQGPVDGAYFGEWTGFDDMYGWTLELEPIALSSGNVYWLEVASDRNVCPDGECIEGECVSGDRDGQACDPDSTCFWHWWQTFQEEIANDWSMFGTNDRPDAGMAIGSGYVPGSGKMVDLQWCLGSSTGPLTLQDPPDPPQGACCDCDMTCVDNTTLDECTNDYEGVWSRAKPCSDPTTCYSEGDDCSGGAGRVASGGLNCTLPPGPSGALPVGDGLTGFDTTCYTSDGPLFYGSRDFLGNDIWFAYTVTTTGELVASMCMSGNGDGGYDSYMGIYHDYGNPNDCPCPGIIPAPPTSEIKRSDEGCNGIADEGSGYIDGIIVFPGECYTVRLGGWGEGEDTVGRGRGAVDITTLASACFPSTPPEPERLDLPPFYPVSRKVRYLSFEAQDVGHSGNVRVTFVDVPSPYDTWNGCAMFVTPPEVYCENGGQKQPTEQEPCTDAVGGLPNLDFLASTLSCNPLEMGAEIDWNELGTIHVFHEGIVPGGVYDVQVADSSCATSVESSYSDPLIVTMSQWGDAVKDCSTTPCGPPNDDTGIVDVTAVLDKYKNLTGNVMKVRADLEGSPAGNPPLPDQVINITDVTFCLGAFLGDQYPPPGFPLPSPKPVCCP